MRSFVCCLVSVCVLFCFSVSLIGDHGLIGLESGAAACTLLEGGQISSCLTGWSWVLVLHPVVAVVCPAVSANFPVSLTWVWRDLVVCRP